MTDDLDLVIAKAKVDIAEANRDFLKHRAKLMSEHQSATSEMSFLEAMRDYTVSERKESP